MARDEDIHRRAGHLVAMRELIANRGVSRHKRYQKPPITQRNAELILEYERTRALEGLKVATRVSALTRTLALARMLGKDFDRATRADIKVLVTKIDENYSPWVRIKMRGELKRFVKWLKQGDDYTLTDTYPEEVRWIKRGVRKRDLPTKHERDCWTEEEMKRLIAAADNARDRAFAAALTETGARIGEIGNLDLEDVYEDEFGYLLHLFGKTGDRNNRVLYAGPHLARWLNQHPKRDGHTVPLFLDTRTGRRIQYPGFEAILKRLAKRSGVSKPCNPHIFRHSRATLLQKQGWSEQMIKAYMGWTPDSRQLDTYGHMKSDAANRYMLSMHGIKGAEKVEPALRVQTCLTCTMKNGPEAKFCERCGRPLTHKAMLEYNHEKNKGYKLIEKLLAKPENARVFERLLRELDEEEAA